MLYVRYICRISNWRSSCPAQLDRQTTFTVNVNTVLTIAATETMITEVVVSRDVVTLSLFTGSVARAVARLSQVTDALLIDAIKSGRSRISR